MKRPGLMRKIILEDNNIEIDKFLENYKVKMIVFGGNGSLYESYLCSLKKQERSSLAWKKQFPANKLIQNFVLHPSYLADAQ